MEFDEKNAHAEQERCNTPRRSRNPVTTLTETEKVHVNKEAQVFVHDLDLFVTVRLLDEASAALSLRMLCSKHGHSLEEKNGETPRLTKNGKTITCTMDNFVPLVASGLSSYSSISFSSTHSNYFIEF